MSLPPVTTPFAALVTTTGKLQRLARAGGINFDVLSVGDGIDSPTAGNITVGAITATHVILGAATIPTSSAGAFTAAIGITVTTGGIDVLAGNSVIPELEDFITYKPSTVSPATVAERIVDSVIAQTTSGAHTAVVVDQVPLPSNAGAPSAAGATDFDYDITITGTATAVGGRVKGAISYTQQTAGSPVLLSSVTTFSIGTNAGALPAGWSVTVGLDAGHVNIVLSITTDASDTYNANATTTTRYTE